MDKEKIILNALEYAKNIFEKEGSGHDFWHTKRVYNNAVEIAKNESCDEFIVKLAALLHDVDDYKIFGGEVGETKNAREFMESNGCSEMVIEHVIQIISTMSFKGDTIIKMKTIEGEIVQDADRLDGLGAIGIARVFTFGGHIGRTIYDPLNKYRTHLTLEEYKNVNVSSINHFYEKLLKLKDLMNTDTGKKVALKRHEFLESYLKQFYIEWDGNDLNN